MNNDTVLYLTKTQAVAVANFSLQCELLQKRFDFAVKREEVMQNLYIQTKAKSEIQDTIISKLNLKYIECVKQIDLSEKVMRSQKKKAIIRTGIVSICVGVMVGVVLSN